MKWKMFSLVLIYTSPVSFLLIFSFLLICSLYLIFNRYNWITVMYERLRWKKSNDILFIGHWWKKKSRYCTVSDMCLCASTRQDVGELYLVNLRIISKELSKKYMFHGFGGSKKTRHWHCSYMSELVGLYSPAA